MRRDELTTKISNCMTTENTEYTENLKGDALGFSRKHLGHMFCCE